MILQDKVAFITGGARGMGRAIAMRYADEGCDSVIVDVLDKEGEQTVGDIKAKGRDAIYLHCDVSNSAQVKETVEKAIEKFGKIDILNNCAGVGTNPTPFEATTEEEWDRVMNINCKGTFLTILAVAPYMKKQKSGKIMNIVSVAAFETGAMNVHYHASKAAQASVTRSAAADLAPYNVCVNMIHPGMVLTDMSAVFSGPGVKDVEAHQRGMAQNMVPLKRIGTTEDIAKAALFLASPEADYITGDSICVSGGSGLMMKTP
ncbi:MAG: SDR family oxidoreductase [Dehalococcoidales bacterium]|nr:MAG: SDR family oxidoreductase [Dehalococcoidales bacterium]